MAVITAATFQGLDIAQARINSEVKAEDVKRVAEGQANVYEAVTSKPVGASIVATPHRHNGIDGAVIPIPLGTYHLDAGIPRATADDLGTPGYAPVCYVPVGIPPGVSRIRVLGIGSGANRHGWRCRLISYDASGFEEGAVDEAYVAHEAPVLGEAITAGGEPWYMDLDTSVTDVFRWRGLEVSAWDGEFWPAVETDAGGSGPQDFRRLRDVHVLPVVTWPEPVPASEAYLQPGVVAQTLPAAFLPVESGMVADDIAGAAFVLNRMSRDDRIIRDELVNHGHGGGTLQPETGGVFSQPLVSHALGVMRSRAFHGAEQLTDDETLTTTPWSGRVLAPCLTIDASTTAQEFGRHRFQMPRGLAADLGFSGTASRLQCAVLIHSKTDLSVSARLEAGGLGSEGEAKSVAVTSTGRRLVVVVGLLCSPSADGSGNDQALRVAMRRTGALVDGKAGGMYGYALALV